MKLAQIGIMMPHGGTYPPISDLLDNTPIYFNAAYMKTMMVETANGGIPNTAVAADGDAVGTAYSLGFGAHFWRTVSNTNKPIWKNQGGVCYLTWTTGSISLLSQTTPMRNYMRPVHAVTPSYRFGIYMRLNSDTLLGGSGDIVTTKDPATNTAAGILFRRNVTTGTRFIRGGNASVMNINTTATSAARTAASGWHWMFWDQSGTTCRFFFDDLSSPQSITATAAGADVIASQGMDFGGAGIDIAYFKFENGTWDAAAVTAFKALTTTANSTEWASVEADMDMNSVCFSDAAGTTPAVDGGKCRVIKTGLTTPFGPLTSFWGTSASDAASPVFRASALNGRGAIEFDGTGNMLTTYGRILLGSNGGRTWRVDVTQNLDATDGSHLGIGGGGIASYIAKTGSGYASPSQEATHGSVSGSDPTNNLYKTAGQNYNVMATFRDGGVYYSISGTLSLSNTGAHTSAVNIGSSGGSVQGALWFSHMRTAYLYTGTGYFNTNYMLGLVNSMNTLFAL